MRVVAELGLLLYPNRAVMSEGWEDERLSVESARQKLWVEKEWYESSHDHEQRASSECQALTVRS